MNWMPEVRRNDGFPAGGAGHPFLCVEYTFGAESPNRSVWSRGGSHLSTPSTSSGEKQKSKAGSELFFRAKRTFTIFFPLAGGKTEVK